MPQRSHPAPDQPPSGCDPQHPDARLLLWAYVRGIFPMADPDTGAIEWFAPDPRAILPLQPADAFHVPHALRREVRRGRFEVRSDRAFERVVRACATARSLDNRSWMNDRLMKGYLELFEMGHAHSVEAWLGEPPDQVLVGGLYGVHIGGAFFGESMFSRPDLGGSNSSKVCLVHLVRWLRSRGFALLDTQFANPHLEQFGCVEIPAEHYLQVLAHAVRLPVDWGAFKPLQDGRDKS